MAKTKRSPDVEQLPLWEQAVEGPETKPRDVQAERVSDTIPESAQEAQSLVRVSAAVEARTRKRVAHTPGEQDRKRAELLAWGDAHAYWELNYCRPDGSLGQIRPGLDAWRAFVEMADEPDLDLAWMVMEAWRADESHPDQLLQVPVVVPRRGVEDRGLFMIHGKALEYPLVRFRASANGMVYHVQAGREIWLHRCLMATDEWLSWAIFAVMHYQNDEQVRA